MKKAGNKNLKIIAATSMAIFSLLTTFTAAFAWFIALREENDDVQNINIIKVGTMVEEISFYKYLGTSTEETIDNETHTYYGFDYNPVATLTVSNNEVNGTAPALSLGMYSLMDPHHPVLVMFKVNDNIGTINARTDFTFLGNSQSSPDNTVASYSALEAVDVSSLSGGEIYEVTTDEEHGSVTTQYTLDEETKQWEMSFITLRLQENPLSSVIKSNSLTFDAIPARSNHNLYLYTNTTALPNNSDTHEVRDSEATFTSCLAIDTGDLSENDTKSFVDLDGSSYSGFNQSIELFNRGSAGGFHYIGLVLDYYSTAVEYICYHYLGHNYISEGLQFRCDWEMVI